MATIPVRKFAISVDPEEVVDFEEDLAYFDEVFTSIGFEQIGTYKYRYSDRECTITGELRGSRDGFELWMLVQAPDAHEYRLSEVAEAFAAYVVSGSGTRQFGGTAKTGNYNSGTGLF